MAFLGKVLKSKTGDLLPAALNWKNPLLIYFSASWCPPCRGFTPVLTDFYKAVNSPEQQVEIIFATLDESKKEFDDYYMKMPWLSLPFEEKKLIEELAKKYQVQSIPTLLLVNSKGEVLDNNCRNTVAAKGKAALDVFRELMPKI